MANPCRAERLLVAAIDIGTTFSGYAFSTRSDFETDPQKVFTNDWSSDGAKPPNQKAPSVILLKPDKSFDSFGYRANIKYGKLLEDDPEKAKTFYYFKHFKMDLYHKKITLDMVLEDEEGKEASAMTVFSETIKYLKDHLMLSLNRLKQYGISDVFFVITVPAIWSDAAKQFMRTAAEKAGIPNDQMILAYEPECSSLYCSRLPDDKGIAKYFQVNRKLMIVDLGGGTVDITVIKVVRKENKFTYIEHVCKVNGGPFGGNNVNKKFEDFLGEIFGANTMSELKRNLREMYEDIMNDIETHKKTVANNEGNAKVKLKICGHLADMFKEANKEDLKTTLERKFKGKIQFKYDKLIFHPSYIESFLTDCFENIKRTIDETIYHKGQAFVSAMILVGGFSESPFISSYMKKAYPAIKDIVSPFEASLAVVKGAVIYGHDQSIISGRICQETIGVALHRPYIPNVHLKEKTFQVGDQVRVDDCFEKIFSINEFVRIGQVHSVKVRDVLTDVDKYSRRKSPKTIEVYGSKSQDPKYVSDPGCVLKGQIKVYPPRGEWPDIVEGTIEFEAGGTELLVRYNDNTDNRVTEKVIDFY